MNVNIQSFYIKSVILITLYTCFSCYPHNAICQMVSSKPLLHLINDRLDKATKASVQMAIALKDDSTQLPRTYENGKLITANSEWWTSGFFPGLLWYLYENKPNNNLKILAERYTNRVEKEKINTSNHDVGFMIYCSFGNGYRITKNSYYKKVIITAAQSLSSRYNKKIGLIKSWNSNKLRQYPVIIDNMMNLELLEEASKLSENQLYNFIAINHADKTMLNHFRDDFSSYHLVSYDTINGKPHLKQTVQGFSDESAWARGQGWGLYGFTMMYRETGKEIYLKQAENIAHFILNNPTLPEDGIPYWDFNAPRNSETLRDASSGAIIASALIQLSQLTKDITKKKQYLNLAKKQVITLSSNSFFASSGSNGNFILMHSVGSIPGHLEVDTPLTYADYYYVEALLRLKSLILNHKL